MDPYDLLVELKKIDLCNLPPDQQAMFVSQGGKFMRQYQDTPAVRSRRRYRGPGSQEGFRL